MKYISIYISFVRVCSCPHINLVWGVNFILNIPFLWGGANVNDILGCFYFFTEVMLVNNKFQACIIIRYLCTLLSAR